MGYAGRAVVGKASDMGLIDHQVFHGNIGMICGSPVKVTSDYAGTVPPVVIFVVSPVALAGNGFCVRIQKDSLGIKTESLALVKGAVQPVGIFHIRDIQIKYDHGIDASDLVIFRKFQHGIGFILRLVEQEQLTGGCPVGLGRKADPAGNEGSAHGAEKSGTDFEAGYDIQRLQGHIVNMCHF